MVLRIAAYVAVIAAVIWAIGEFAQAPREHGSPDALPRMPPLDEPQGDEGPAPSAPEPGPEPGPAAPEPAPRQPPRKKGGLLGLPVG